MDVCLKEAGPWEGWRGDPDAAQNSIAECGQPHLQAANPGRLVGRCLSVPPSGAARCRDISPFPLLVMLNSPLLATPPSQPGTEYLFGWAD